MLSLACAKKVYPCICKIARHELPWLKLSSNAGLSINQILGLRFWQTKPFTAAVHPLTRSERHFSLGSTTFGVNQNQATMHPRAQAILSYWFGHDFDQMEKTGMPPTFKLWFGGGPEVDRAIAEMFKGDIEKAAGGQYDSWEGGYEGLALCILLDQFTRNVYRGTGLMYEEDWKAVKIARGYVERGENKIFPAVQRKFLYLPFMHSESLADQELCLQLHEDTLKEFDYLDADHPTKKLLATYLEYAKRHYDVVKRWGRFPHRNAILGRENTPEEAEGFTKGEIPAF